jgi:penicillin-binding protein 1A
MPSRAAKRRFKKVLLWFEILVILVLGAGVGIVCGALYQISKILPDERAINAFTPTAATTIYSSDGVRLAVLADQYREPVPLEKIPKHLQNAIVAIEDSRFYEHHGLDFRGVARALWENIRGRDLTQQGASTITQQLARNIYLTQRKTVSRKLKELMLAVQIERTWAKQQILETYLNQIYFGSGAHGVQSAAKTYFGKDVKDLNLAQCALIAGIPQRPNDHSPYRDMARSRRRRDVVLDRMAQLGFITDEKAALAKQQGIKLVAKSRPRRSGYFHSPYFVTHVVEQLRDMYGDDLLYKGGFRIVTTLNSKMQEQAEKALVQGIQQMKFARVSEGAIVCIDPHSGYIRAMVGGTDFKKDQFNCATQAKRQPGSSFKAFVYTAAIDTGNLSAYGSVSAKAPSFRNADGKWWTPRNHSRTVYGGKIAVRSAFAQSVNTAAVNALRSVGAEAVSDYAHRLGIKSKLSAYPSLALGASEVTVLEMASAYGTFATRGLRCEPISIIKIKDRDGATILENVPRPRRVNVNPATFTAMDGLFRAVVTSGTGSAASRVLEARGKTGTSENYTDAWFVGYTPDLATAVWAGNRDNKPMRRGYGGTICAPIWAAFMAEAVKVNPKTPRPKVEEEPDEDALIAQEESDETEARRRRRSQPREPEPEAIAAEASEAPSSTSTDLSAVSANSVNMVEVRVCDESYLLAGPNCPSSRRLSFVSGMQPHQMCDVHARSRGQRGAGRRGGDRENDDSDDSTSSRSRSDDN